MTFRFKSLVCLQGLRNNEFNGKVAIVQATPDTTNNGRYRVELIPENRVIDIKLKNLVHACYKCHKPNAAQYCGKCKFAMYCNRDCQLADWKKTQRDAM